MIDFKLDFFVGYLFFVVFYTEIIKAMLNRHVFFFGDHVSNDDTKRKKHRISSATGLTTSKNRVRGVVRLR